MSAAFPIRPRLFKSEEYARRWAMLGGIGLASSRPMLAAPAKNSEPAAWFRHWLAKAGRVFLELEGRGEPVEWHRLTGDEFERLRECATATEDECNVAPTSTTVVFFTGTREGLTEQQSESVRLLLVFRNVVAAHHGCCVGADEFFNLTIAGLREGTASERFSLVVHGYPAAVAPELVSETVGKCNILQQPAPPLTRNVRMAEVAALLKIECDRGSRCEPVLIACPKECERPSDNRGGTWHALRNFSARGIKCYIVWPSGEIECQRK